MPFKSEKQRRYLHANHPEIAKRWEKEYSNGGILGIGEKNWLVDEEGNPITLKEQPPKKNWTIDEEGNPIILEEPPREKHWIYDEEITTEEGNDISLVDESENGVSTLFRAKNGGTPQLAKKSKDGTRPGYRGSDWAGDDNQNDFSGMDSGGWDPGVSSPGTTSSGGNVNTGGGDQEDDVAQMMHDMSITPDHSPNYTGSDAGWVVSEDEETEIGGADYIGPKDKVRIHNEILNRKKKYDSPLEQGKRAFSLYRSAPKTSTGNPFVDLALFGIFAFQQNKKKKERIAEIDADLELLDKIGAPKHHHSVDTIYQKLTQEKLDLIQPRSRDEDTGGDGPEAPVVAPVTEEIEDSYAMAGDWLQTYRDLKAKQALSSSLQEKWADEREWQQNTMFANSGGLANLFRVKN